MPTPFHPGQRWISEGEPELGLGQVLRVGPRTVTLAFKDSEETREYALDGAALRRVAFRRGDTIRNTANETLTVQSVCEREGLLHYDCGHLQVCERFLSDTLDVSGPRERLFLGRLDPARVFELRHAALAHQYRHRKSEACGFLGGRIDLLPHQLSIASEVTGRLAPRVLLADEVGLGKTIEACLILHRLLVTGRVRRVLILVPESLVHQWFLELLRRFSLWFHIFDEARCRALGDNPFLDDQLVLCDLGWLTGRPQRLQQALEAGWDLVVVDEAHHLGWSPGQASPEYAGVEALGRRTPGLLLLTATPEQLGQAGHFARLRLLDPDRFHDLEAFIKEGEGYREVARLAERVREAGEDAPRIMAEAGSALGYEADALAGAGGVQAWIDGLLDQHGTGRVMFRNTRATVAGFPKRQACLYPLEPARGLEEAWTWEGGEEVPQGFAQDPRIHWLAGLLQSLEPEKVLLICHARRQAEAIEAALASRMKLKMAVFHEGLSLVQRDRAAAWFAEEGGARLLICSEIGSEGRNFQFAHHLVLFDLPMDPTLLEQRMGRLDRIGQTATIRIHVPFVRGSGQEVLARWYQEGLNAFEENLQGGGELLDGFRSRLQALGRKPDAVATSLEPLLQATRAARKSVAERLEAGRDRLLEWNSCKPEVAARIIAEIRRQDARHALDTFLLAVFELFCVEVEEVAPRTYQLGSAGVLVETFPGLGSEGLTITFDRQRALAREDLTFLTWDHPFVTGALDRLLGSEHGCCGFAHWPDPKASGLYLETIHVLECVAPPHLHVDRFLPPTPVWVLVDHQGREGGLPSAALHRLLKDGDGRPWLEKPEVRETLLPRLLALSQEVADRQAAALVGRVRREIGAQLGAEIARLRELRKVNRSIREDEITSMEEQRGLLERHLGAARLRLDALRLIRRGKV